MADILSSAWSEVASDNQQPPPDGWPEGMARSAVNNAARETMGAVKRLFNRLLPTRASVTTAQDGNSLATAYQVDFTVPPPSLVQGLPVAWRADKACGAAPTVKVNTLPAQPLLKATSAGLKPLVRGDIVAGQHVMACYDSLAQGFLVVSLLAPAAAGFAQPGDLKQSASDNGGLGWIACDGRALSRSTYAALFLAIGTKYGTGDGSTTFNIPDARGRAMVGAESMPNSSALSGGALRLGQASAVAAGWAGGAATHTLAAAEMPSHTHTGASDAHQGHKHDGVTEGVGDHAHGGFADANGSHAHNAWTDVQGDHTHTYQHAGGGGGGFLAGATAYGLVPDTTSGAGNHAHNVGMDVQGLHTHTVSTYGAGAHSHSFLSYTGGGHTHQLLINAAGGGAAHNNLQPSLAVNTFIFTGVL